VLFGCSNSSSDSKADKGSSVRPGGNLPPTDSSGTPQQPSRKDVSEQPLLKPSPFFARFFNNGKEVRALLDECVKKDKCTVRWGPPSWAGFQDDTRADPRRFRSELLRLPFRFRSAEGQDLSCEPEDAARALTALRARVEAIVREGGGRLGESKDEQGLRVLDVNGKLLREARGRLASVRVSYVVEHAQGEVLARIDLQEGAYIGPDPLDPFQGRSGVLAVRFEETVSRR
jgi:hypothetical protein